MKLKFVIVLFAFTTMSIPALAQTGDIQGTVYQRKHRKIPLQDADVRIIETEQTSKDR